MEKVFTEKLNCGTVTARIFDKFVLENAEVEDETLKRMIEFAIRENINHPGVTITKAFISIDVSVEDPSSTINFVTLLKRIPTIINWNYDCRSLGTFSDDNCFAPDIVYAINVRFENGICSLDNMQKYNRLMWVLQAHNYHDASFILGDADSDKYVYVYSNTSGNWYISGNISARNYYRRAWHLRNTPDDIRIQEFGDTPEIIAYGKSLLEMGI